MMKAIIDELVTQKDISDEAFLQLLDVDGKDKEYLFEKAREISQSYFKNKIYVRALIEISNYCKNDCFYCGIRKGNTKLSRYRLNEEDILNCAKQAYELGFSTFVLQGGEDDFYDSLMCDIITKLRKQYPDCAITLSLGEKDKKTYEAYYHAGANRYLLRHESRCESHYQKLHPKSMRLDHRIQCLHSLKEIGYQTGTGIMVGSPFQTKEDILQDIRFIQQLKPEMIGIGPYLPHTDTPFANYEKGSLDLTLILLSIFRILFPKVLLPATTALATLQENGRELGILAGANVVMPNVSPQPSRKKYSLYDNKVSSDEEAIEGIEKLQVKLKSIGYEISWARGDYRKEEK